MNRNSKQSKKQSENGVHRPTTATDKSVPHRKRRRNVYPFPEKRPAGAGDNNGQAPAKQAPETREQTAQKLSKQTRMDQIMGRIRVREKRLGRELTDQEKER